jgi:pimeloyl-ACP methyl ester carboxylesterase/predicted glycosyltransferase
MRAIMPVESGTVKLHGFQVGYELFGHPQVSPVLLLPTWQIAPSLHWRMQVPYLARHFRVITWDPPGIGGGERTTDPAAYECDRVVDYAVGLLDHLGVEKADVIGLSMGGTFGLWLAARYPERVKRMALLDPVPPAWAYGEDPTFWEKRDSYEGWEKRNANYWREDYEGWLDFFFHQVCTEPHSTKAIDDLTRWAHQTTPDILIASVINNDLFPQMPLEEALQHIRCPMLLIHGGDDHIADIGFSRMLAEKRPDWEFVILEGSGHVSHGRDPVKVNQMLAGYLGVPKPKHRSWQRAAARKPPRALFISNPTGLGHIQRDLAIARELRQLVPDLQIDWLAQPPITHVLEQNSEAVHPLSNLLASESAHWEQFAGEHELHCFYGWREMDEILLANFMVFLDAVRETPYDLWIGDEAWEVDYYLHENPELKTAPFVFLTDFLGWLPMERSNGSREAFLTADYNTEMIKQVERYRRVRDRAIYIGDYEDLVPERFGPDLPFIPEWAKEHFTAVGYITPFDPADYADTRATRARLGFDPDRPLVICTAGGTAVGRHLLRKASEAWPLIQQARPDAYGLVVAGPRLDPSSLPPIDGLEIRSYVHNLYEYLAVADLGIVQGGLSTAMELTVNRRPFLYFPLKNHCEQVYHVAHRLERYRAGKRLQYADVSVESLAAAAVETLGADTSSYHPFKPGAAGRAATLMADLL